MKISIILFISLIITACDDCTYYDEFIEEVIDVCAENPPHQLTEAEKNYIKSKLNDYKIDKGDL